jgi:tetratricopeptide (TPR) repeat protein
MISSTFKDLGQQREALKNALHKQGLHAIWMEDHVPGPGEDIISSSLDMVRRSSAYIGLISQRYGQVLEDPRNPNGYSVTRLEFEEAQRLGRPTLVFVMGETHPVTRKDIDTDPVLIRKLEEFRERARVGRLYVEFNSLDEFKEQALLGVGKLKQFLEAAAQPRPAQESQLAPAHPEKDPIPPPPAFYPEPPYISSHNFVGRRAELERLSDWAASSDPHPVLLFEAIGGTGKSMLTWEWTTLHATGVRTDWAGRFWYSFYEKGAVMADFCRRALAYITRRPLEDLRKRKTADLAEELLHHLNLNPWLLVLDGLERVLVAYHRFDAAQVADEQVDTSRDQIADRNPCAAIRPDDDDLLRLLAGAAPSKILITTRLTPRVLLNPSNQAIPGVLRVPLQGLRPADAEELIRSCGVTGTSQLIQDYLKSHCDCHPLVIGVVAGLVNHYFRDRGNFDAWAADDAAGAVLNLADLDLVQKRNHILHAALAQVPQKGLELLSVLALISESVDAETLRALNPHLPPEPKEVSIPQKPESSWQWNTATDEVKELRQRRYQVALTRRQEYEAELAAWRRAVLVAEHELETTIYDLEHRGLLQYDPQSRRYDLHPVVRGFVVGGLKQQEKEQFGQRVVDYFSTQTAINYDAAESLEDLRYGLHTVRAMLQMGSYQQAYNVYVGLSNSLFSNLQAYEEVLSMLRPFFTQGWETLPETVEGSRACLLSNDVSSALDSIGRSEEALAVLGAAITYEAGPDRASDNLANLSVDLRNFGTYLVSMGCLASNERVTQLALDLASLASDEDVFMAQLNRCVDLVTYGRYTEAGELWSTIDSKGRNWSRAAYRPGDAEWMYARLQFQQGRLTEDLLAHTEQLSREGRNRKVLQWVHALRGEWLIEQGEWALAAESLSIAVHMSREVKLTDAASETRLALAKFHLGQLANPREEAEHLTRAKQPSHLELAKLWLAIGDTEKAKEHALAAYKRAWCDGEPYVRRYYLNQARALLEQLGAEIPSLDPYDPAKDVKFPWEDAVAALIERVRAEKEAEAVSEAAKPEE